MPMFICPNCCTKLEEIYELKKQFLGNFFRFQRYVEKLKTVNFHCKTKYLFNEVKILVSDIQRIPKLEVEVKEEIYSEECTEIPFVEVEESFQSRLGKQNKAFENNVKSLLVEDPEENRIENYSLVANFETVLLKENAEQDCALNEDTSIPCSICGNRFKTQTLLPAHAMMEHKQPYTCSKCNKTFYLEETLKVHLTNEHLDLPNCCSTYGQIEKSNFMASLFACSTCGKNKKLHCTRALFTSPTCGKKFKPEANLTQHSLVHMNKTRYVNPASNSLLCKRKSHVCRICLKTFDKLYNLKRHMVKVHCEKKIILLCHICNKSCDNQFELKKHVLTHREAKPYLCSTCGKRFSVQINLKRHMYTHDGTDRPWYHCLKCNNRYTSKCSLKKHMLWHEYVPHPCTKCKKIFLSSYLLIKHMQVRHKRKEKKLENPMKGVLESKLELEYDVEEEVEKFDEFL